MHRTTAAEFFCSTDKARLIPVVGHISSGESFRPAEDQPPGVDVDHVRLDLSGNDQVAVFVRGDPMAPVYRDGDLIVGSRLGHEDLSRAVGRDCIVKTADGKGYVKRVSAGSRKGQYRLQSYILAWDDIEDVELEWAAPIRWIGRRD